MYKPMGAERVVDRTIAQQWCHNKVCAAYYVDLRDLFRALKLLCEWNMCYALMRAGYIFSQEEEKEWNLSHPRNENINLIKFSWHSRCCTTQMANGNALCNGTRFRIWWKINILFNRTGIFNLMRNLVPLHNQPFAICILLLTTMFVDEEYWL